MLEQAGIAFDIAPAAIDEDVAKREEPDPFSTSRRLAEEKAVDVSRRHPGAWVIGSDSIASLDGRRFDKPRSMEEAARHLAQFSGNRLRLTSAVALARDGVVDWSAVDHADLSVRRLSASFIALYLDREWPAIAGCAGAFRLEGPGIQLFDAIEGSHFTILGMPLLPLLEALRARECLAA